MKSIVLFLSLLTQLVIFFFWFQSYHPKKIEGRTIHHIAMAAHYQSFGRLGVNKELHEKLERQLSLQTGIESTPLETQNALLKEVLTSKESDSLPEDNENGFVYWIMSIWNLTGTSSVFVIYLSLFLFNGFILFVVFQFFQQWLGLRAAVMGWLGYLCFSPSYASLMMLSNHWFVLPILLLMTYCYFLFLKTSQKKYLIGASVALAIGVSIRNAMLPVLLVLVACCFFAHPRKRVLHMALILMTFLSLKLTLDVSTKLMGQPPSHHSFWYPVFVGLGEVKLIPDQEDTFAYQYVESIDKNIVPYSTEWDHALRDRVFAWFREKPSLFFSLWASRAKTIFISSTQNWDWPRVPARVWLRDHLWLLSLVLLIGGALHFRRYPYFWQTLSFWFLSCSVFLAEGVFIIAKKPTYYLGWALFWILPLAFLPALYEKVLIVARSRFLQFRNKS